MGSPSITIMDRVMAFLRLFGDDCTHCYRKSGTNCYGCRASMAKNILRDIEAEGNCKESAAPDYSLYARMEIIKTALRKAGRPMRSNEIKLSSVATPQLKCWTLLRMISKGVIGRRIDGGKYVYFLTENQKGNSK